MMRASAAVVAGWLAIAGAVTVPATAQGPRGTAHQDSVDTSSPEAIVTAAYASIARRPGADYDWRRFRRLFLPEARLISNPEQRQGAFSVLTTEGFIGWIAGVTTIGGAEDRGFAESAVHNIIERYGDVAHVFSTYEKHLWGETEVLGWGINSFQLVWHEGRWWIVGIVWDEETGAGPVPAKYRPQ